MTRLQKEDFKECGSAQEDAKALWNTLPLRLDYWYSSTYLSFDAVCISIYPVTYPVHQVDGPELSEPADLFRETEVSY
jgi:hypothetical protein